MQLTETETDTSEGKMPKESPTSSFGRRRRPPSYSETEAFPMLDSTNSPGLIPSSRGKEGERDDDIFDATALESKGAIDGRLSTGDSASRYPSSSFSRLPGAALVAWGQNLIRI